MPEKIRKLDQQRHELKALRYLLDNHPESMQNRNDLPGREDFQTAESRLIFDVLVNATSQADAVRAIDNLDLEEIEVESFLRLGGQFYHSYPHMVKERGQDFRNGKVEIIGPSE